MRRVCVQWPRLGPYHLARLQALHALLAERGVELVALETAGHDALYDWRTEDGATAFRREQVFPDAVFESLSPWQMHQGMVDVLNRIQPDAVAINSYSLPDARACLLWARAQHRVAVCMTDTKADDGERVWWREWIKARIVQSFDAALLAGAPQQRYFEQLGFPTSRIFLGYDVVDNAFFAEHAAQVRQHPADDRHLPGLDEEDPFFLVVGRFIPLKNIDGVLRAYQQYRARSEAPWRLVLVGDGPERPRLEQQIREAGIGGVTLAGFQQIEALPAYYGRAGALIHATYKDTWGLVVNEAMAAGLPVLVSERAGCVEDLVQEGRNGYRFNPEDAQQLAAKMVHLAAPQTDREALGRQSEAIIAAWSPARFATSLWQAVLAGRSRSMRPVDVVSQSLLWALQRLTRSVHAFHATET